MKPREVEVKIKLMTNSPLSDLRDPECWQIALECWQIPWGSNVQHCKILQVQANVIRPEKKGRKNV